MSKSESDTGDEVGVLAEVHETRFKICLHSVTNSSYEVNFLKIRVKYE